MARTRSLPGETDRKYSLREIAIAVGLAAGATKDEVAESLGCTSRTIYNELGRGGVIQEIINTVKPLVKVNRREFKAIAKEKAEDELEKYLGAAIGAIERALTEGDDVKTAADNAWKLIHQLRGSPTSTVKTLHGGTVTHRHELYVLPKSTLRAFGADVERDADLLGAAKLLEAPAPQFIVRGYAPIAESITVTPRENVPPGETVIDVLPS